MSHTFSCIGARLRLGQWVRFERRGLGQASHQRTGKPSSATLSGVEVNCPPTAAIASTGMIDATLFTQPAVSSDLRVASTATHVWSAPIAANATAPRVIP